MPDLKTLQEILSQQVCALLAGRDIRALRQAKHHQCPAHGSAHLAAPGHATAKGRSQLERPALVQSELPRKRRQDRLGTIKALVEPGGSRVSRIVQ